MIERRSTSIALLALLYGVSGIMCAVGAAFPANFRSPVRLLAVLAAVGAVGAVVLWLGARRLGALAQHVALGLITVLSALLAWRSATAVGIVGLAPIMLAVALFAGHFLAPTAARLHVLAELALVSAGAWAAEPSGFLLVWLNALLAVAITAEAHLRLAQHLRAAAGTDPLTGVANRRAWEAETDRHLAHAARTGEPVTLAILDLDDFKLVNDEQGHDAGDALLRELTLAWRARLRGADVLGRYGGDEFVLCLPASDERGARNLLGQLERAHAFSWSTGVATARPGDTVSAVLARADADLYARKQHRRTA